MERPEFTNEEIYHLYNRGVEKRKVFMDDNDHFRFIHNLFEFNDSAPAGRFSQRSEVGLPNIQRPRKCLVDILVFCLMPNHFHLMVRQKVENGITEFMRKLGTGYTNYFNQKYERVGTLFQGKFKAAHVQEEPHFLYLPYYIHLNPLDLYEAGWREQRVRDTDKALAFLDSYRWSSYLDYIGKKNFPSVTQRDFLLNVSIGETGGSPTSEYYELVKRFIRDMGGDFSTIEDVRLD